MKDLFVVIDGNSLINRAYYAIQRPMITKDGTYTQGIYGFISMLNKMLDEYVPEYVAVAFDRKAPTFRHREYEAYKAGRKSMPDELAMQMPIMKEVLKAMNIKTLELDGYEADDILGTLSREAEEHGMKSMIVTGDKDALQLATDRTKILITKKGISEFDLYDYDKMLEVYGFTPQQFIDYKGLRGDTSDNIPGVPGVGEKTASKLIEEYGSVEGVYENLAYISSKSLKTKLEDNMTSAYLSKRLATIDTHVPISFNPDDYKFEEPNYKELIELYKKLEFRAFIKKLSDKKNIDVTHNKLLFSNRIENVKTHRIESGDIGELRKLLDKNEQIVLNVFHNADHKALPHVYGVCLMKVKNLEYIYLNISDPNTILEFVKLIREYEVEIWGHDLTEVLYPLMVMIYKEKNQTSGKRVFKVGFDSAVAQYLLEPARSSYDLAAMMLEKFGISLKSNQQGEQIDLFGGVGDKYFDEGLGVALAVLDLKNILLPAIEEEGMNRVFYDIELPLIEVLTSMEAHGFAASAEELKRQGNELTNRLEILKEKIYKVAGEEFNINSPKQLGSILFEKLNLPHGKKNKSGYSTDIEVLEGLRDVNPIIADIIEYRGVSKLLNTYALGLVYSIGEDGKIHPHFKQTVTATGRISCVDPNLQNIPIRQEIGRNIRKAFIPDKGYVLTGADYSQIELRVLAHLSEDKALTKAFEDGEDIHKTTASRVFNVDKESVTSLQRSRAKAINFGVIYGMSNFGLSNELNISRKEAEEYIEGYFSLHRRVKAFMDMQVAMAKSEGYTVTITGRKRFIPEINASSYVVRQMGERLAMNSPIQGSAADIIKAAMNKVYDKILEEKLSSSLILQIHDELIINTAENEIEKVKTMLKQSMEEAVELIVPLIVDINTGNDWYELK